MANCTQPIVHVYVMRMPFPAESEIFPPERAKEIESCTSEQVRRAKFYVWKLLESALERSFGLKMKDMVFTKAKSGKWESPDCHFSLSHSGQIVAVALSSHKSVGVDVELVNEVRFSKAIAQKILTPQEREEYERLEESARPAALNGLWTKKEALFKRAGVGAFVPRGIETAGACCDTRELVCGSERYFLTVACEDDAVFHCGEGLQIV